MDTFPERTHEQPTGAWEGAQHLQSSGKRKPPRDAISCLLRGPSPQRQERCPTLVTLWGEGEPRALPGGRGAAPEETSVGVPLGATDRASPGPSSPTLGSRSQRNWCPRLKAKAGLPQPPQHCSQQTKRGQRPRVPRQADK